VRADEAGPARDEYAFHLHVLESCRNAHRFNCAAPSPQRSVS